MLANTLAFAAMATASAYAAPVSKVPAACSSKTIDNFANWANKTNSLGAFCGDDSTMKAVAVTGSTLSLTAEHTSYFYENLPCQDLDAVNYDGIAFRVGGPPASSFLLELQTRTSCDSAAYARFFHNVTVPSGAAAAVTVRTSDFVGADPAHVTSLTFSTFNQTGVYTLSDFQLICK